jgi:aconitate hydratase
MFKPLNLSLKILRNHLVEGDPELPLGAEIGLRIDQTLTQDATGTMAFLQFEALCVSRVRTETSVSYVDHNMLQTGFENADDHLFLQTAAKKFGAYFSRAGNGICHQVHLERFAVPGKTLLGSDSHTPTAGGLGMLAMGAGGLDVAAAMAGAPFYLRRPKILGVRLVGRLPAFCSGKDVILEVLRRLTVKGGVGRIVEYYGPGVATLDAPGRATITNMGAELGATTSVFPADAITRRYLKSQGRENAYREAAADPGATYDEQIPGGGRDPEGTLDLSKLEPQIACPHSPDNVKKVREVAGRPVRQVCIGSCTNSSFRDLAVVAALWRGKRIHESVSAVISPGSRNVLTQITKAGVLADLLAAGARLIENACGPCIGMGQSPASGTISVRTFNRNFEGRSGTFDAQVYLCGPEVAAACALTGKIADPRDLGLKRPPKIAEPVRVREDEHLLVAPVVAKAAARVEIRRGPNIRPVPLGKPLGAFLRGPVLLKVGDNITTDHIMPAGAKVLPLRSNIPAISEYVFAAVDKDFSVRAKTARDAGRDGFVVCGQNYGQGSSREHAALAPMYLGLRAVLVKSFARIHRDNLINFGILPLTFCAPADYDRLAPGDELELPCVESEISRADGDGTVTVRVPAKKLTIMAKHDLSARQKTLLKAGGLLNFAKAQGERSAKKSSRKTKETIVLTPRANEKPRRARR